MTAAEMPAERSPSPIKRMRAPAARISAINFSWRGRSSTITTRSSTSRSSRFAMAFKWVATGASRSTAPLHDGPTTIFSMYRSGAWSKPPRSLAARTTMALGAPVAQRLGPSSGSTAMSTCGKRALGAWVAKPTFSPIYNMGASSRSPSPMTMVPSICTESMVLRMASTVISSALWPSPKPMVRAAAMAAVSTTRRNSKLSCASMRAPDCPRDTWTEANDRASAGNRQSVRQEVTITELLRHTTPPRGTLPQHLHKRRNAGDTLTDDQFVNVVGAFVGGYAFEIVHVAHDGVIVDDTVGAENVAGFSRGL